MGQLKPLAALLFSTLVWGVTPVFLRSLSTELGPAEAMVIRYIPVALISLAILLATGGWRIARSDWPRLLVVALLGLFGYSIASVYGFASVPAGIGGLIYATQPLFIALLAAVMLGERLTLQVVLGFGLALIGTGLLFWNDLAAGHAASSYATGMLLLLFACFVWAFYSVPGKALVLRYGTMTVTTASLVIATVPMLAFVSPRTVETLTVMTARHWAELGFVACTSTFLAMFAWTYSTARLPAATTGAFLYLIPVIAVVAGTLVLGETLTLNMMLGGLLILGGVAVAQFGQRFRRVRHEKNAV